MESVDHWTMEQLLDWTRTVYVASRFANRDLVKAFTLKLATCNPPVHCIQTWPNETLGDREEAECAAIDLAQIDSVPTVVVLTERCREVPGGMHFEAGYAYATGKNVIVIGPRVNVFYYLPRIEWYPTVQDYFKKFGEQWTE